MLSSVSSYTGIRECPRSSRTWRISSALACRRSATMRLRGTITADSVSSVRSNAREAISPARGSSVPAFEASSTSCCSSSGDRRASVKFVRSPKKRRSTLELAVSSHTSGRISQDSP